MKPQNCLCSKCSNKDICSDKEMDILFKVMDNENDITLTDGKGVVLKVSDSYEEHYGVRKEEVIGKSVYELEEKGIFQPSVTSIVLKERRKVTILQVNKIGDKVLTTGVPIFADDGEIKHVISFNSIDIADVVDLQDKYNKLNELIQEYSVELQRLQMMDLEDNSFVAKSKSMSDINELVLQVANVDANVLITGETGVGKSLVAKLLHQTSRRAKGSFVEINCGTIPPTLIESELFGYEKGAFTGASAKGKIGKVELANGGTLFLDEIGELPLDMQIKLLQVIQQKVVTRVGGLEKINVDFRLVAATNKNLEQAIKEGTFREDLFYRLNVISIDIPPLRERRDDIIPLVMEFLQKFNLMYQKNLSISHEALAYIENYDWPGNIRQLENFVERLTVTFKDNVVQVENLPKEFVSEKSKNMSLNDDSLEHMMDEYEKYIFVNALDKYKTSIAVGKALKISQTTAARKLRKYIPGYADQRK